MLMCHGDEIEIMWLFGDFLVFSIVSSVFANVFEMLLVVSIGFCQYCFLFFGVVGVERFSGG